MKLKETLLLTQQIIAEKVDSEELFAESDILKIIESKSGKKLSVSIKTKTEEKINTEMRPYLKSRIYLKKPLIIGNLCYPHGADPDSYTGKLAVKPATQAKSHFFRKIRKDGTLDIPKELIRNLDDVAGFYTFYSKDFKGNMVGVISKENSLDQKKFRKQHLFVHLSELHSWTFRRCGIPICKKYKFIFYNNEIIFGDAKNDKEISG